MKVLVYGDGQLAQMLNLAGAPLGIEVSAVNVKDQSIVNPVDKSKLPLTLDNAIAEAKALTVEFEHVPLPLLEHASESGKLLPHFDAVRIGADRVIEKRFLEQLQVPNCEHRIVTDVEQLADVVSALGERVIFKSSLDGYDGYGQWRLSDKNDLPALSDALSELDLNKVPLVAEKMAQFDRELSIVGARNAQGQISVYPLVENLHYQGQLHVTVAPATTLSDTVVEQASSIFSKIVESLDYVGVLAVEMFQIGETVLVNELAPRVHNSGHWTLQGAQTSQFENQLRAVLNLPLGDMTTTGVSAMVNIIGCGSLPKDVLSIPGCHLHWYGKSVREKRKMGHINVVAQTYTELAERLAELATILPPEYFPLLEDEVARLRSM